MKYCTEARALQAAHLSTPRAPQPFVVQYRLLEVLIPQSVWGRCALTDGYTRVVSKHTKRMSQSFRALLYRRADVPSSLPVRLTRSEASVQENSEPCSFRAHTPVHLNLRRDRSFSWDSQRRLCIDRQLNHHPAVGLHTHQVRQLVPPKLGSVSENQRSLQQNQTQPDSSGVLSHIAAGFEAVVSSSSTAPVCQYLELK